MSKNLLKSTNTTKISTKKSTFEEDSATVDLFSIITELGGEKEDLSLIRDISDDENNEAQEISPQDSCSISKNEISSFIESLEMSKYSSNFTLEKKVPDENEETDSSESLIKKEEVKTSGGTNFHFVKSFSVRKLPLINLKDHDYKWYSLLKSLTSSELVRESSTSDYWIGKLYKYSEKLFETEIINFEGVCKSRKSEFAWMETVFKSGTLVDKLNAYVVRIQESSFHRCGDLNALLSHVSLKSRRPLMIVLESLPELFKSHLLHPDRKLKSFDSNSFDSLDVYSDGDGDKRDKILLLWFFESKLKDLYGSFLELMKEVSKDSLVKTRTVVMSKFQSLLIANPEKEKVLLECLVNKLGDPVRAVASKAVYELHKLLEIHTAMKAVVIRETERLLYRPNISPKAQYYGIIFLSQILLSSNESPSAKKLLDVYFSFFKAAVKKGEVSSKLMTALLTGVKRTYPYADSDSRDALFKDHEETLFRVVQMGSFNVGVQALSLLFHASSALPSERFYSSLYRKLLDPEIKSSSKKNVFLNLIFKTMKCDSEVNRIKSFVRRLLQVTLESSPGLACGVLFLISEVVKSKPETLIFEFSPISAFDDDDEDEEKSTGGGSSWIHRSTKSSVKKSYDPLSRNPLYAGAETQPLWELNELVHHSHPSVSLFASKLIEKSPINYPGDPLGDFTLIRFLDRFVFRNPKAKSTESNSKLSRKKLVKGIRRITPGTEEYLAQDVNKIPLEERFIHTFFAKKALKKSDDPESDAESVTSEDFNDFLDNCTGPEDIDFAGLVENKNSKIKKKSQENVEIQEDSDSDFEDISDDVDIDGEEEMDFDEEGFGSEDDQEMLPSKPKKKIKRSDDLQGLLASAEEFSHMMEDDDHLDPFAGGSGAYLNKDKASKKQIKWEEKQRSSGSKPKKKRR